jgi:molybdenum cofactor cytidylyltransferase
MKFGEIPVSQALGAVLAHSVKHGDGVFKKGRVISAEDIAVLEKHQVRAVFTARLEAGDVPEDEAASRVAQAIAGYGIAVQEPFTGRANLHAEKAGVFLLDQVRLTAINHLHESLTVATPQPFDVVDARQMVATVKIIPFAVPRSVIDQALAVVGDTPLVSVAPFQAKRGGLVITRLQQTKPSLIAKSEASIRERLEGLGGRLGETLVSGHSIAEVKDAIGKLHREGHDPILVFGASAIVDRGDVIPAAVVAAGGEVIHLGMPVDPGNLLMLGVLDHIPVIGVPSCARSPKLNGFDWVLARLMAGLQMTAGDIMDMGAGGLLKEIASRPSPREQRPDTLRAAHIGAVVLAAGQSLRMGANKLLAEIKGKLMIRHTVESVLATSASPVIVVTGHHAEGIEAALAGLAVQFAHNPQYAEGLSTSLRAGIGALPGDVDGAVVCLGDMPLVEPRHVNKLIAAFNPTEHRSICVPVANGQRGNPVLWGRQHFPELLKLTGDKGARSLLDQLADEVVEVAISSDAVLADVDTPEALAALRSAASP